MTGEAKTPEVYARFLALLALTLILGPWLAGPSVHFEAILGFGAVYLTALGIQKLRFGTQYMLHERGDHLRFGKTEQLIFGGSVINTEKRKLREVAFIRQMLDLPIMLGHVASLAAMIVVWWTAKAALGLDGIGLWDVVIILCAVAIALASHLVHFSVPLYISGAAVLVDHIWTRTLFSLSDAVFLMLFMGTCVLHRMADRDFHIAVSPERISAPMPLPATHEAWWRRMLFLTAFLCALYLTFDTLVPQKPLFKASKTPATKMTTRKSAIGKHLDRLRNPNGEMSMPGGEPADESGEDESANGPPDPSPANVPEGPQSLSDRLAEGLAEKMKDLLSSNSEDAPMKDAGKSGEPSAHKSIADDAFSKLSATGPQPQDGGRPRQGPFVDQEAGSSVDETGFDQDRTGGRDFNLQGTDEMPADNKSGDQDSPAGSGGNGGALRYDAGPGPATPGTLGRQTPKPGETASRGAKPREPEKLKARLKSVFKALFQLLKLLFVLMVIVIALGILKRIAQKRDETQPPAAGTVDPALKSDIQRRLDDLEQAGLGPESEVVARFQIFLKAMAAARNPKPDSLPVTDFYQLSVPRFPHIQSEMQTLTRIFCDVYYGRQSVSIETLSGFRSAFRETLAKLAIHERTVASVP